MADLAKGLYEQLISQAVDEALRLLDANGLAAGRQSLDPADSYERLTRHVAGVLQRVLRGLPEKNRIQQQVEICNAVLHVLREKHEEAACACCYRGSACTARRDVRSASSPPRTPGTTERRALDELVGMGAQVRVSYETRSTRLHAKAWLFGRDTGFSTAYIGSSNLTQWALVDGLEWNVRLSQVTSPDILEKFQATFDSYWEEADFEAYDPARDAQRFDLAVSATSTTDPLQLSAIDVIPFPHQREILERLAVERERHHRFRTLIVAATGTGKTIVAALDYRRLRDELGDLRLLFVAHRKELLGQSLSAFRQVLREGSFGELYVDGYRPKEWRHVFASVQSLAQLELANLEPDAFDIVIVDEFHRAAAPTYKRLLDHLRPKYLVGLTATPERADGESVLDWFDGRIAIELRLWEALERGLLCPFHYFGLHDDIDLSGVTWSRRGYDVRELENLYTANHARVAWSPAPSRTR